MEMLHAIPAKAAITETIVEWTVEEYPDLKYLISDIDNLEESMRYSESDVDEYGREKVEDWIREDRERVENYGDTWYEVMVTPKAVISVELPTGKQVEAVIEAVTTGGIESDAPKKHLEEMQEDALRELKTELMKLGFPEDAATTAIENPTVKNNAYLDL